MGSPFKRTGEVVLFERVCDEGEDFLVLVEEEHDPEVAESLVGKLGRGYEFEALDLAKVGRVAEHVDVEQFGDIVVAGVRVFLLEGGADGGALLGDEYALVCDGLCGPDRLDQGLEVVVRRHGHGWGDGGASASAGGFERVDARLQLVQRGCSP